MIERLVVFLYRLLSEHLPAEAVDRQVRYAENQMPERAIPGVPGVMYFNKHVEAHARELAGRLLPPPERCNITWSVDGCKTYPYRCDLAKGHGGQCAQGGVFLSATYSKGSSTCGARLVRGTAAFVCGLSAGHTDRADARVPSEWHEDRTGVPVRWRV